MFTNFLPGGTTVRKTLFGGVVLKFAGATLTIAVWTMY